MSSDAIRALVERYYSRALAKHGATPRGVDWNSLESQQLRFDQLLKLLPRESAGSSLIDYGCGYGALLDVIVARDLHVAYRGFDISSAMVEAAEATHLGRTATFVADAELLGSADYAVASGIFNVKLDVPTPQWVAYVLETLDTLAVLGRRGFAFNMLSGYADPEKMRDDLYYGDPCTFFQHCRRYSRRVALLHDYPLYEFTIIVRAE